MRQIFIYLLLSFNVATVLAQEYQYVPFPKSGAFWSERLYSHDEFDDEKTMNECFAVNGEDTIINDLIYTKVYYFKDSRSNWGEHYVSNFFSNGMMTLIGAFHGSRVLVVQGGSYLFPVRYPIHSIIA